MVRFAAGRIRLTVAAGALHALIFVREGMHRLVTLRLDGTNGSSDLIGETEAIRGTQNLMEVTGFVLILESGAFALT